MRSLCRIDGRPESAETDTQHEWFSEATLDHEIRQNERTSDPNPSNAPLLGERFAQTSAQEKASVHTRLGDLYQELDGIEMRIGHYQAVLATWRMEAKAIRRDILALEAKTNMQGVDPAGRKLKGSRGKQHSDSCTCCGLRRFSSAF